jgi:hypothetical protein
MRARLAPSIAAISVVGLLTLGSTTAFAQNADAEALFSEGERLLKAGSIGEACDAFEASNRIEPRAGTLVNLGLCREKNGQLASAWSAFKDAAARAKDPKKKQLAEQSIASIEPRLSYLTILVPDESRVDGLQVARNGTAVDPALWNRGAPVDGGTYTIAGRAPGHEEWSTTVEVPKENGKISVEVPRFKELGKLIAKPTPTPVVAKTTEPLEGEDEGETDTAPGMFTSKRKLALGVGAVGLLGIGAGVLFGIQANGFESDAYALCPDPNVACADSAQANSLISDGQSRATLSYISFGVGGLAIAGAAVLWVLGAPHTESVTAIPRATGDSAGVDVRFTF